MAMRMRVGTSGFGYDAWVFFSHEDTAPSLVERMLAIARRLPEVELG